jgi:repressor LexA
MKKQHENILKAIIGYVEKHGYPPTFREIGETTGLKSTSSVHGYLKEMFTLGILETDAEFSNPRAIRIPNYVFVKKEGGMNE